MSEQSVQEVLSMIEEAKRESEATFRRIGSPGSAVYNFCHADRQQGSEGRKRAENGMNQFDVDDVFSRTLEESVRRSKMAISGLNSRKF